ncbi:MAG: hypothetical protein HY287_06580 [Planctomycetes bacterium]|nr:hypothetical protein [Planctomycetota bacterium]
MQFSRFVASLVTVALLSAGCVAPKGESLQEKHNNALRMRDRTLQTLYAKEPGAKSAVENAPGYAVFDQFGVGFMFLGTANGYSPVTDNQSKQVTYMRNFQFTPGFGIGGKRYQSVLVFGSNSAMKEFAEGRWQCGGEADAACKFGDTGGAVCTAGSFNGGVKVYQITEGGIMLRADIPIMKYWQDDKLNGKND